MEFSGTDTIMATQGAEALGDAIDECVRNVAMSTAELGVTFFESDISVDGGKIMLTAGAPRSTGHEEERLLRAGRRILDRAGTLPLRIGVNRGRVFAGELGPFYRRTYSVKGDAINLAARVMAKAKPGQMLATRDAIEHSDALFDEEVLEPFMVKGKSQPISAVAVHRRLGVRERRLTTSPLVGRQAEMATLGAALEAARQGKGSLVQIVGEPGIGKSRLLQELTSGADDFVVTSTRCDEYESSTPYYPFRLLLRDLLGIGAGTTAALAYERLQSRVGFTAPQLIPWLPLLGVPLDLNFADSQETRELDPQFRRQRLELLIVQFLDCLLPTATIIMVDDVQLMDEASSD
ncbi:MAG: AAA family ATPase, partial [Gaiellaceae bacterium]